MPKGDKNQLEDVTRKKKQTLYSNFGEKGLKHSDIRDKKKNTSQQKYKTDHPKQSEEVKKTCKEKLLKKYGVDNWMKTEEAKVRFRQIWKRKMKDYVLELVESRNLQLVSEYETAHQNITIKCKKCQNTFEILWNSFQQGGGVCPTCFPGTNGKSFMEGEIKNFITSLGFTIIENDKKLIKPYEIDIIVNNTKIAIEFCGLWCHSSGGNVPFLVSKDYHKMKLEKCADKGYRLITIFEDEWILKRNIVISRLKYILGVSDAKKVRASDCQIKIIDFKTSKEFLDNYHLQGSSISSVRLGAFIDNNILVSVMTFAKKSISKGSKDTNSLDLELSRFASHPDFRIHGIAKKFLDFLSENYLWGELITFADRRWSVGGVYKKLGFDLVNSNPEPNYWYWGKTIRGRSHRFNFCKSKLVNMEHFNQQFSEKQIMALEGFAWIYDCGHLKFKLTKK